MFESMIFDQGRVMGHQDFDPLSKIGRVLGDWRQVKAGGETKSERPDRY
jgi:hypothetical protein